ncbi:hypothetical protein SMICM304S_07525 [Streptomyces microflavus]
MRARRALPRRPRRAVRPGRAADRDPRHPRCARRFRRVHFRGPHLESPWPWTAPPPAPACPGTASSSRRASRSVRTSPSTTAPTVAPAWLAEQGLHGVAPNGSLGEYQTLTYEERDRVVETAVANASEGFTVMPGVESVRRDRGEAARAVRQGRRLPGRHVPAAQRLPGRRPRRPGALAMVASAGLPVTAYNNPIDTEVDLRPGAAGQAARRRVHRGREGVLRRRPQVLRHQRTRPRARPDRRHRRHPPGSRRRRRQGLGRRLPPGLPACLPRPLQRLAGRRSRHRAPALPTAPLRTALGRSRVRPGDQARPGLDRQDRGGSVRPGRPWTRRPRPSSAPPPRPSSTRG